MTAKALSLKEVAEQAAALERVTASLFGELQKSTSDPMVAKVLAFIDGQEKSHSVTLVGIGGACSKDGASYDYDTDLCASLRNRVKAIEELKADIASKPKRALEKTLAKVSDVKGENIAVLRHLREGYPRELVPMIDGLMAEDKKHLLMIENVRRRLTLPDPMSLLEE